METIEIFHENDHNKEMLTLSYNYWENKLMNAW